MWARRCGLPRRWPSRIKVIIFSLFSGTIGLSIYMYMAGSNISYLDLTSPVSEEVKCLENWPVRSTAISLAHPQEWLLWWVKRIEPQQLLSAKTCHVPGVAGTSCRSVLAPVDDMKRPLSLAVGQLDDVGTRYDVLGMWARFFLVITFSIWIGMTTHDLALIGPVEKDFILDVSGVNAHCPVIRSVWRFLAGYRPLVRLVQKEQWWVRMLGLVLAVILAPILLVWNVVVFNFVIVPLLLLAFVRYPIRMSRAWVFIVCSACSIYGLALTVLQVAFLVSPGHRPRYAVTWQPEASPRVGNLTAPVTSPSCTCGCEYAISFSVCANLTIVGVATALKSLFVALRCLKGLRRSQWANLLSVVFPVPVTLYSVDWRQSNGQHIKFRSDAVAVQEEIAFDPFAMMDEQLDSAFTTVHLRPEPVHTYRRADGGRLTLVKPCRILEMPSKPDPVTRDSIQVHDSEYIGCCGFPWPTGGQQGVYDPEFIAHLDSYLVEEASLVSPSCSRGRTPMTPTGCRGGTPKSYSLSGLEDVELHLPDDPACVPRGCGDGAALVAPAPPAQPREHSPLRWEEEDDDDDEERGPRDCEAAAAVDDRPTCDPGGGGTWSL